MSTSVSQSVTGRWQSVLPLLGVEPKYLINKHGPCPICGGKDRWRWDNRAGKGTWFCSHDGSGDGFMLLQKLKGWDFKETARRIEEVIGAATFSPSKTERSDGDKRDAMNRLWISSMRVQATDPVGIYLSARCGVTKFPASLRFGERVRYQDEPMTWHPAMIAMVSSSDGKPAILHRTYLTKDGRKAAVDAPRRLMPGTVAKGCAVRLGEPAGTLGIAEGIETALSASTLFGVPCWAAVNAVMLAAWIPPAEVKEIIVFGDNDESFTGQQAAFTLAHRLRSIGVSVRAEIPSTPGTDWNDVHRLQNVGYRLAATPTETGDAA